MHNPGRLLDVQMFQKKETCFYKRIQPCISKYLTKHTENGKVQFESEVHFFFGNSGFRDKFHSGPCDLLNAINKSGILLGLLFIKYNYAILEQYQLYDEDKEDKHELFFQLYKNGTIPWKNVGIVVTASHNPPHDNGVKILDEEGKQIEEYYENCATKLVNAHLHYLASNRDCSVNDIIDHIIDEIAYYFKKEVGIDMYNNMEYDRIAQMDDLIYYYNLHNPIKANICIGLDTRDSGIFLNNILLESLQCLNIKKCINNMGYATTPCVHFMINYLNCWKEDKKINKILQEKPGYTFHKTENDLDHLQMFYLEEMDQIKQLYFTDAGRRFCSTNQVSPQEEAINKHNHLHMLLPLSIEKYIGDSALFQKETSQFHMHAYNSEHVYFDYFRILFEDIFHSINENFNNCLLNNLPEKEDIYVDCSNGVGGLKLDKFTPIFKMLQKNIIKVNYLKEKTDVLNVRCGSHYVHSKNEMPRNMQREKIIGKKCCSLDGDADRIVYFYVKENDIEKEKEKIEHAKENGVKERNEVTERVVVIDGTKMICLLFKFITNLLSRIRLDQSYLMESNKTIRKISIFIINTAYANSSCINYLEHIIKQAEREIEIFKYIKVQIKYAKTGVKHLERLAKESSIGIFFEPNGHGTIFANIVELDEWAQNLHITDDVAFATLLKYILCFSQTTGDALIDFALIELTLKFLNLTIKDWDAFYELSPSACTHIICKKSHLQHFQTHPEHEQYLMKPISLQKQIEEIVHQIDFKHGRCFVRPSGCEPLIRIYAEAETSQKMQQIIYQVKHIVQEYINNV